MGTELALIEHQLKAIRPRLDAALGGIMPSTRLEQTILVSCERTPALLDCTPQSVLNAAMTFAVLGLPVDGATGQGFLIPFKRQAQAVIGYRGYNTLGARAGLTIMAGTVREGDTFLYELGSQGFVKHIPILGNRGRIQAFWAVAVANDRPPVISLLALEDVLAIKASSAAVKSGKPTPWNDPEIGFPAMGEKSARRRLTRSTPLRIDVPAYHLAARMEEAFDEQGKLSWITPRGVIVEGEPAASTIPFRQTETPTAEILINPESSAAVTAEEAPAGMKGDTEPSNTPPASKTKAEQMSETEAYLLAEAQKGTAALRTAWENLRPVEQKIWEKMKDLHFKKIAAAADEKE